MDDNALSGHLLINAASAMCESFKSPDFREVMAVLSVGACGPEAFIATRAYAAAADDHHHLIPQTCCSRNHVIFWTSFFMDL